MARQRKPTSIALSSAVVPHLKNKIYGSRLSTSEHINALLFRDMIRPIPKEEMAVLVKAVELCEISDLETAASYYKKKCPVVKNHPSSLYTSFVDEIINNKRNKDANKKDNKQESEVKQPVEQEAIEENKPKENENKTNNDTPHKEDNNNVNSDTINNINVTKENNNIVDGTIAEEETYMI